MSNPLRILLLAALGVVCLGVGVGVVWLAKSRSRVDSSNVVVDSGESYLPDFLSEKPQTQSTPWTPPARKRSERLEDASKRKQAPASDRQADLPETIVPKETERPADTATETWPAGKIPGPAKKVEEPKADDSVSRKKGNDLANRSSQPPPQVVTPFTPQTSTVDGVQVGTFRQQQTVYKIRRLRDVAPQKLRLAVTPPNWDDIGQLLNRYGKGFEYSTVGLQNLQTLQECQAFNIIFLTCDDAKLGDPFLVRAALSLRSFVEKGGTLYASDRRFFMVNGAFPEYQPNRIPIPGISQTVEATVVDPVLKEALGRNEIPLKFDLNGWIPSEFNRQKTKTILQGTYRSQLGQVIEAPLLVKFNHKAGTVIFTSFHNERQVSDLEKKLLDYLVFSAVNAKSERQIIALFKENGVSAPKIKMAHLTRDRVLTQEFEHESGEIQIGIGFQTLGARLKLTAVTPNGEELSYSESGIFVMEIPAAQSGRWQFKLEAETLPFANFPVVIALGAAD